MYCSPIVTSVEFGYFSFVAEERVFSFRLLIVRELHVLAVLRTSS